MTPSPTLKVLSILRKHRVRALLMGGQACIVYGAAEFSRDVDVAVRASDANLQRLRAALAELRAEPVCVPALSPEVLQRGHACRFRAAIPEAEGMRLDVMSVLHGCAPFEELWRRRRRIRLAGFGQLNVLALPDLLQAKKTQRDKDWPMLRRLVEVDFQSRLKRPARAQITFWLREVSTLELLFELCRRYPGTARRVACERAAVQWALAGDVAQIKLALHAEEQAARALDYAYWQPLRAELFQWRQARRRE